MFDLIIKNGKVVSSEATFESNVLVKDGKIAGFVQGGELPEAVKVYDAQGKYVLTGIIDIHVHFRDPGVTYKEDFGTGSIAAACGGVTTVVDMPNVDPPTATVAAFEMKKAAATEKSFVDFGIIGVVLDETIDQLESLAEAGVVGYKIFMGESVGRLPSPSDGGIIEAMKVIAKTDLRVGVHAEDNSIIKYLTNKFQTEGRNDSLAFIESRPHISEKECISRAIMFAEETGCKLHIYHMSSKEGVALVKSGNDRGVNVSAETGPHYLLLDYTHMNKVGSMVKINPPVRTREDGEALWQGLLDGTVLAIATDHSPHTMEEKMNENIWKAFSGFCGVETAVPLMLTEVNRGRMTINQYVQMASEGPAKCFNMYPTKGSLIIGTDADFTIVDMEKEGVLKADKLHSKNKVTPFDGFAFKGMPVATIVRGNIVAENGEVVGSPAGQMVRPIRQI